MYELKLSQSTEKDQIPKYISQAETRLLMDLEFFENSNIQGILKLERSFGVILDNNDIEKFTKVQGTRLVFSDSSSCRQLILEEDTCISKETEEKLREGVNAKAYGHLEYDGIFYCEFITFTG